MIRENMNLAGCFEKGPVMRPFFTINKCYVRFGISFIGLDSPTSKGIPWFRPMCPSGAEAPGSCF